MADEIDRIVDRETHFANLHRREVEQPALTFAECRLAREQALPVVQVVEMFVPAWIALGWERDGQGAGTIARLAWKKGGVAPRPASPRAAR